ncbi:hypothetical protein HGM15179_019782 [Zosterops borbonicus]|uniref:Retroviral nucleocapsid Gag protein p24 C-terminal domain-containing protein n=1 Tax=Zosterops borbonicus TaxID=364589 RepID=A0A8K1FY04_9PASS|nr:hypothetical protein HGM15179_019782 [Zosterops borbonicus]
MALWKQCDNVLRSYKSSEAPVNACSSLEEFSSSDAEAEEEELLSEAEAGSESDWGEEFSLSPQDAVLEDVSIPVSELGSPGGADGALGQLVPADGLLGGGPWAFGEGPQAFGEPVTVAMPAAPASPAPPIPAPTRRRSGGGSPSLCAFLALGGGEESQALHAPLLELDAVTTQCPHCGRVTKYPIGTVAEPGAALPGAAPVEVPVEAGEAPEGQALIDLLLDPVPVGGQSIPPCTGWAAPPVGFRATGGTMLGLYHGKPCMDLRDTVGKHGLGCAEIMQVLRVFGSDTLPPYDIRNLAHILLPPVEYDIFESKWAQLAHTVVMQNTALGQQDPRHVIGMEELLRTGSFADPKKQVVFDPLVLEQCTKTGMAAVVQTIEMAAPQDSFVTVVQGAEETFLQFAGRLTASVERQVDDPTVRTLLLKQLERSNCNAECRKIIETLPGNPSVLQMAEACAKVGTTGCKVAAVAAALQPAWNWLQGGQ